MKFFFLLILPLLMMSQAFSHFGTSNISNKKLSRNEVLSLLESNLERMKMLKNEAAVTLIKFDIELDLQSTRKNIWSSTNYRRLLALRMLYESSIDDLLGIFNSQSNVQEAILERIAEIYSKASNTEQIVATDVLNEIFPFAEFPYKSHQPKHEVNSLPLNHALHLQISFYQQVLTDFSENNLQTQSLALIEPSTNRNGNIVGTEFPANMWALTYDDGPHVSRTNSILTLLKKNNVYATFFQLAGQVKAMPNVSMSVLNDGHEMANHSYNHPNLINQTAAGLEYQIGKSTEEQTNLWGISPRFFRCPYGSGVHNYAIRKLIADNQMIHAFWTVDTLDWQDTNPESIFNRAKKQIEENGRGIILFHDIHQQTIEASRLVIKYLQEKQARLVTLSEAVDEVNQNRTNH